MSAHTQDGEPLQDGSTLTYREAIERLAVAGYAIVEKVLYTESLGDHLDRLAEQPAAASEQLVKVVCEPEEIRLHRVGFSGGREFVDENALAIVRRAPA